MKIIAALFFSIVFTLQAIAQDPITTGFGTLILGAMAKHPIPLSMVFGQDSARTKEYVKQKLYKLTNEIKANPKDADVVYRRGLLYMESGGTMGARGDFERSYDLGGRGRSLIMNLGKVNYLLGDKPTATKYFDRILKKDSTNSEAYLHLGVANLYVESYRYQTLREKCRTAIPFFDKALRFNDQSKEGHILRGYAHFCLNQHNLAITDLAKAIEIDPKNQTSYVLLIKIYQDNNQDNKACEVIKSAKAYSVEIPDKLFRKACE